MAIFLPQGAEEDALKLLTNNISPHDLTLKLFVNNVTPGETDTASTYTEMTTQGYAAKTLTGASWTFTAANPSHADYAQQTWTFNGTGGTTQVYGYFLVDSSTGNLRWVERFSDGPYPISNNGDAISVTPVITASEA